MAVNKDGFTVLEDGEILYDDLYLLSETDEKGIIKYASSSFCKVAGFTEEELIGQPHNVVRHPEMPRAAFKMLWDSVQSKGYWTGYVKNAVKGGGYYWVYATVLKSIIKVEKSVMYLLEQNLREKISKKPKSFTLL